MPTVRATLCFGRKGTGAPCHLRQVLDEVVERREPARGRVAQHRIEPALELAREHGDAHVPASVELDRRPFSIDRHPDTWKPPIAT
jgi:hypothetical protein